MKYILETERLLLRELTIDDATNFYQLNLNPNVMRYTGDDAFSSVEEAHTFLANYSDYERNGYGRWAVIRKEDNAFLGWCGLKYNADIGETDIGFRFFEEFWNKGYATESAKACLEYGFTTLGLPHIIGRAMRENMASIKVLEKIGLVYDNEFDFDDHIGVLYITI
ncbi:MAG: GNAT family N-acetyltransferase [Flavobacterium sp.]